MGATNDHAPLAPSHSDTWALCAGSKNLEAQVPPDPEGDETEHSRRGTAAHQGFERCMTQEGVTPNFLLGRTMDNGVTLDQEDVNAIRVAVEHVKSILEDAKKKRLPVQVFVEERLNIGSYLGGRTDIYGTADLLLFIGNTLYVIDYKHGYQHVEAEGNRQLILYAIGAMAKAYDHQSQRVMLREVKLVIIQPRGQDKTNPIRIWTVKPDDLFEWAQTLERAAKATDNPDAPLTPGEQQCKWCRARTICSAREEHFRTNLEKAMAPPTTKAPSWAEEPLTRVPGQDPGLSAVSDIHQVNPAPDAPVRWQMIGDAMAQDIELLPLETRVAIHRQADVIHSFLKENAEGLRKLAITGIQVPGYKLIKAFSNLSYNVSEEIVTKRVGNLKDANKQKLVPLDDYRPRKLLSPRQLLNLLKPLVSERVYAGIEKLTHRAEAGPKLVPESQAGEPWRPAPEEMFPKQEDEQRAAPKRPSFLQ